MKRIPLGPEWNGRDKELDSSSFLLWVGELGQQQRKQCCLGVWLTKEGVSDHEIQGRNYPNQVGVGYLPEGYKKLMMEGGQNSYLAMNMTKINDCLISTKPEDDYIRHSFHTIQKSLPEDFGTQWRSEPMTKEGKVKLLNALLKQAGAEVEFYLPENE